MTPRLLFASWPKISKWSFIFSITLVVIGWIFSFLRLPALGPDATIPLHYNVFLGIDEVGSWKTLFWLPGFASFVLVVNLLISVREREHISFLANTLAAVSLAVSTLALAGLFFALVIN